MDPLQPGDPVRVGSYRLLGRLGSGGMGQVFLGVSPGGRKVGPSLQDAVDQRGPLPPDEFTDPQLAELVGGCLVNVPDVLGFTANQAIQALQAAGFKVEVTNAGRATYNNNSARVVSYSPTGQAPRGSTITIQV
jgi:hypothetical protein